MRIMLKAQLPVEKGNEAIADGTLPKTIEEAMTRLKPEAAYFFAEDGKRTALMIFDMDYVSQIPVVAEPFFVNLNADVDFRPVMNAEDLQKGLQALG